MKNTLDTPEEKTMEVMQFRIFTWIPQKGKYVMTSFYPYQWDLALKRLEKQMFGQSTHGMNYGAVVTEKTWNYGKNLENP